MKSVCFYIYENWHVWKRCYANIYMLHSLFALEVHTVCALVTVHFEEGFGIEILWV